MHNSLDELNKEIDKLKRSIYGLKRKRRIFNESMPKAEEKIASLQHLENSTNPKDQLIYHDALLDLNVLQMELANTNLLICFKEEELSKLQSQAKAMQEQSEPQPE